MKTILLADDHAILRETLRPMLEHEFGFQVIAEATTGREAVNVVRDKRPDIVIMDIAMPDMNGIEVTLEIKKQYEHTQVIVLSGHNERHLVDAVLKAGASGYLLKDCVYSELKQAIDIILQGDVFLSPQVAKTVLDSYLNMKRDEESIFAILTSRERQVLQGIAEGKTVKELAADMHVSPKTIETHRKNLMDKLNIHNVPGLVKYAIREGITDLG